jgi:large subunit ribosomal protein L18e
MISKTKIKFRAKKKTNPVLAETISEALKHPSWKDVAKFLSSSTRKYISLNLSEIDKRSKEGDTVVVLGKVLSGGNLTKKIRICALAISESASEKAKETKSEIVSVLEEIKKNPKAEGVRIL